MTRRALILLAILLFSIIISIIRISVSKEVVIDDNFKEHFYDSALRYVLVDPKALNTHLEMVQYAVEPVKRNPLKDQARPDSRGNNEIVIDSDNGGGQP